MRFSVHDQPDFARVYDEDDMIEIRRGDLRALLDICTGMEFGSNMLNNEEVEVMRGLAPLLGIPLCAVTQSNMHETYDDEHEFSPDWQKWPIRSYATSGTGTDVGVQWQRGCIHCEAVERRYFDLNGVEHESGDFRTWTTA